MEDEASKRYEIKRDQSHLQISKDQIKNIKAKWKNNQLSILAHHMCIIGSQS